MVLTRAERSAAKKRADDAEAAAREALLALANADAARTERLPKLPIRRKKWRVVTEIPAGPSEPAGTPKKRRWSVEMAAEPSKAKTPSVESQETDRASHESAKKGSSPSASPAHSPSPSASPAHSPSPSEPVHSPEIASSPPAQSPELSSAPQSSDQTPAAAQSTTPSPTPPRPDPEFPYGEYQESTQGSGDAEEEEVLSPMREDSPDGPAQQDDSMEETLGACLQQITIEAKLKKKKKAKILKAKRSKKLKKKKAKRVPSSEKESTEPSLKRLKVEAAESAKPADKGKAKLYPEDEPQSVRYVSSDAESRGVELRKRELLHEKGFLDRLADLPQFLRAGIINHSWEELCRPPNLAYTSMVYDFYANLRNSEEGLSVVRGVEVDYSAKAINEAYGLKGQRHTDYARIVDEPTEAVLEEAIRTIGQPEAAWTVSRNGRHTLMSANLTAKAAVWFAFVRRKLSPVTHETTINQSRSLLVYAIMRGLTVNVGEIMSAAIAECARKGKGPLFFPNTITKLCLLAGVPIERMEQQMAYTGHLELPAGLRLKRKGNMEFELDRLAADQSLSMACLMDMQRRMAQWATYAQARDKEVADQLGCIFPDFPTNLLTPWVPPRPRQPDEDDEN